jgi:hypothetical protein
MRATSAANGVTVKAYAGVTGVLVAFDVELDRREGLLGFAVERQEGTRGRKKWLKSSLQFPGLPHADGERTPSNEAPVQKFRWSDYGVLPGRTYRYTVHPVYGEPGALRVEDGPTVTAKTDAFRTGTHGVLFNRAAAASQAFSRDFPEVAAALDAARKARQPAPPLPPRALAWLTRGVEDEILSFIGRAADETWALDVAIYEYELESIVAAVEAAHARGAAVRVVYHAKKNDHQTEVNETALAGLPPETKRGRLTSGIFHHKFIVLSRVRNGVRRPVAVLCGSTNFTHNGVFRQANVLHVVRDADVASRFLTIFERLFAGASTRDIKDFISNENPVTLGEGVFVGFSPRSGRSDLSTFIQTIGAARRDVLFCTAFDLFADVGEALLGQPNDPLLRFGLQNTRTTITGFHRDRTAQFVASALVPKGLEGFLKESLAGQRGAILIHTKLVVTDFTSDAPTVISGSHNLSVSASEKNDENFLIIAGNTDVADCYGVELMRLYDHYRFRFVAKTSQTAAPALTPDDSWTDRYFRERSLNFADRVTFAGTGGG